MSVDYMAGTTLDYFVLKNEGKRMHVMRQGSFSPLCVSAVLDIPIVDCDVLEAAKKNIQLFASVSPASYKPADTADIIYVRSSSATSGISQGFSSPPERGNNASRGPSDMRWWRRILCAHWWPPS